MQQQQQLLLSSGLQSHHQQQHQHLVQKLMSQPHSQTSSRTRKRSTSKTQQQSNHNNNGIASGVSSYNSTLKKTSNNGGVGKSTNKNKKDDFKVIQQYCEQNEMMNMNEMPIVQVMQQKQGKIGYHQKTKSEGATPINRAYPKNQFHMKPNMQQPVIHMQNQYQQQFQNPVLDYQKFLEEEKVYQFHPQPVPLVPKSKSSMGYYSQSHTPNNNLNRIIQAPQSKSPEIGKQYYSNQIKVIYPNMLSNGMGGSSHQSNKSLISSSGLSNYPNVTGGGPIIQQTNRSSGSNKKGIRSESRKKSHHQSVQDNNYQLAQSLHQGLNFNQPLTQSMLMQKQGSTKSYKININHQQSTHHNNSLFHKPEYSIDTASQDLLNESSVYIYDDQLLKQSTNVNPLKSKSSLGQYSIPNNHMHHQSVKEESSYLDASLYEQFIQGPHNVSQYSSQPPRADELQTYSNFHLMNQQRPITQIESSTINSTATKTIQGMGRTKEQFTRSLLNQGEGVHHQRKRSNNQSVQSSHHNSTNKKKFDNRLLMGRTPSPNFLKRIANLMQLQPESVAVQQHAFQNQYNNTGKGSVNSGNQSRRSTSKQQFSSNKQLNYAPQMIGTANSSQIMNSQMKQKFAKQYKSNVNQNRYKSGSITTSANTAQNSPTNRGITPKRNNIKQKTIQQPQQLNNNQPVNLYQPQLDFNQMADLIRSSKTTTVTPQNSQGINPQQNLRKANKEEEKKALAMISSIKEYPFVQNNQYGSQQSQMQQFYQPAKMIGEVVDEDPQPLSSHEFLNFEELQENGNLNKNISGGRKLQQSKVKSQMVPGQKGSQTPQNIFDGGTGSNNIANQNNLLMMSKNSGFSVLSSDTQTYSQHPSHIMPQYDNQQIHLYLEQLRKSQKGLVLNSDSVQSPQYIDNQNKDPNKPKSMQIKSQQQSIEQSSIQPLVNQLNYQTNPVPVKMRTDTKLGAKGQIQNTQPQKPIQQQERKRTQSVDAPQLQPPNIDMTSLSLQDIDHKLSQHTNFQKHPKHQINFQQNSSDRDKTPFELELEQKAIELKNNRIQQLQQQQLQQQLEIQNDPKMSTQEQQRLQKYKQDSMMILKQLQESSKITESLFGNSDFSSKSKQKSLSQARQQSQPKNQVKDLSKNQQIIEIRADQKSLENSIGSSNKQLQQANIKQITQKQPSFKKQETAKIKDKLKKDKEVFEMSNINKDSLDIEESKAEVLLTQEEEKQIREVASDINEKAFYGKLLKKTTKQEKSEVIDEEFKNLSPRSREIATVMKFIKNSFSGSGEPPVTTTDFYRIGKMLGRGAFGKVNLAMHKLVRKLVAIKSLNKECLTDEEQKAKLMKEVSLLLKLRHNHVVKIYETIETEKHIIIVMELCAGGDLLNYVRKRRKVKEPYAKVIFKQIIDGLCYIHSKYIAHRDIKLDNILLDGKGNVKIADFGVSKQCVKGQKMNESCGTPAYIAPEIFKDRGYTFSVDIWSAGVVLFAMLYGTVPFKANNMEELQHLIIKGKYVLKDDISIEARNLLRGLLEVNPEKRLTIEQIYRHKWLADMDPTLELFNEEEREMIRKQYTYNDPRRYNRNENEEPADCFTEHHLESVYNSLQNVTSKSIILAPFNSTQSEMGESMQKMIQENLCEKMMVLNFARRCREIDRQYEFNNNGDLDNGVYHKFVYNSEEKDDDNQDNYDQDQEGQENQKNSDLLSVPMLLTDDKRQASDKIKKRGGRASVENSFEEESTVQKMKDKQLIAKQIQGGSQISKDIQRNRKNLRNEIDKDLVQTYETFQSRYSNNIDSEKVYKLCQFGYPNDYVIKSLEENEPNYCTAGYYLLGMDQNYC